MKTPQEMIRAQVDLLNKGRKKLGIPNPTMNRTSEELMNTGANARELAKFRTKKQGVGRPMTLANLIKRMS